MNRLGGTAKLRLGLNVQVYGFAISTEFILELPGVETRRELVGRGGKIGRSDYDLPLLGPPTDFSHKLLFGSRNPGSQTLCSKGSMIPTRQFMGES